MGLRFRKSISIIPGVKVNFGKTGMSVSAGVPGFSKTVHTSGRVTTSVSLPGTGLSYVTTKNTNKDNRQAPADTNNKINCNRSHSHPQHEPMLQQQPTISQSYQTRSINADSIKSIHKTCDETIDWTEILVNAQPTDDVYDKALWAYLHSVAEDILNGDIDTYLKVIYEMNPLDDLLEFGGGFEFGTDDPRKMEIEFTVKSDEVMPSKSIMSDTTYFDLLQDYVCSCAIRVARDMFALLPIKNVVIHVVDMHKTILSVDFDRQSMSKIKFGFVDPSDTVKKFRHNMYFNEVNGFSVVDQLE